MQCRRYVASPLDELSDFLSRRVKLPSKNARPWPKSAFRVRHDHPSDRQHLLTKLLRSKASQPGTIKDVMIEGKVRLITLKLTRYG